MESIELITKITKENNMNLDTLLALLDSTRFEDIILLNEEGNEIKYNPFKKYKVLLITKERYEDVYYMNKDMIIVVE